MLSRGSVLLILLILLGLANGQPTPVLTDNCLTLSASGNACLQCASGFYLEYFLCLPCAPLCNCTSQHNYCEKCVSQPYGHTSYSQQSVYDPIKKRCHFCYALLPGCIECNDINTCTKCSAGSYLISSGNKSVCSQGQCQSNCDICVDENHCEKCQEGYFLDSSTGSCSSSLCQSNCQECSDGSTCLTCASGYFQDGSGGCSNCSIPNCLTCSSATCLQCSPGYYLSGGTCTTTGYSNCVLYTGGAAQASACQVCQPGYFVLLGSCNQCVGCQLCSLQFLCQSPCQNATQFNYACLQPFTISEGWRQGMLLIGLLVLVIW